MLAKYRADLQREFKGYNRKKLVMDLLAGLTVTAVALPLALAFGVSSGADAAAGLITAILSSVLIGALSGASFQISGPTGAMTAILISLVAKYQLQGVFIAALLSGILLVLAGIFRLGRLISLIPSPVITGFTSGIAVVIALGQLDNFLGMHSAGEGTLGRVVSLFTSGGAPNIAAVLNGLFVVAFMVLWPKKWGARFPASLAAIILAVAANGVFHFDVAVVGAIPQTLFPDVRLGFSDLAASFSHLGDFVMPAVSIAALGMIESLLCGASAGRMKGERCDNDRELLAQGIGNIVIPFFGGVPATAAIARTSVAIKSGGQTRLTGAFQGLGLLASMFLLGNVMAFIPLSSLAGVLMVTAWRMNEWSAIRYLFRHRFKTALAQFLLTMAATVVFDLTVAIFLGVTLSVLLFVVKVSDIDVTVDTVDADKLEKRGVVFEKPHHAIRIVYISGPVFFATVEHLIAKLASLDSTDVIILSMRGVSMVDPDGARALLEFIGGLQRRGVSLVFSGVQPKVKTTLDRAGLTAAAGEESFFWDAGEAIAAQVSGKS